MPALPTKNNRLILAERPKRGPLTKKTFREETVDIPSLQDGEVLVRIDYAAIEPAMRGWVNAARSYIAPVEIGQVMRASVLGRVVASKSKNLVTGDLVGGMLGWQEYWSGPANKVVKMTVPRGGRDIDHLGLFGGSGMTAYFGMFDIGRVKDGDVVVVSGAAGSVGLIACQIALAHPKCKVIAIAGSADKVKYLKELGCHHVFNYKDEGWKKEFQKVGLIDVFFDNVGGEILDLVLGQMNPYARVIACGAISVYNSTKATPVYNLTSVIGMKARIQGFIVFDYIDRFEEARVYLADLVSRGKMRYDYHILEPRGNESGLKRCVEGLDVVFEGKNLGKTIVKISNEPAKSKL